MIRAARSAGWVLTLVAVVAIPARAEEKPLTTKGQIKIGNHAYKMEAGKLYQIRVEGSGFQPNVSIRPGWFTNPETLDKGDTFQAYYVPQMTKEHRIHILPSLFDDLDDGPLDYSISVKPIPLDPKPLLQEKAKLESTDAVYKNDEGFIRGESYFKPFPIKLKARQLYIIDMVRSSKDIDPMLYLEGPNMKIVASDDDSGGDSNARVIFQPRRDGEYRIIATTSGKAVGEFTVTVRTMVVEREGDPKPKTKE